MGFTGQIATIPAGTGSLNSDSNLQAIPATDLIEAEGVIYDGASLRKEPGAALLDATGIAASPAILAGHGWEPSASVQRVVLAAADGKIYKEVGGDLDSVTLVSGLSTTARGMFVPAGAEATGANRKLFYFNGVNPVQVLSADGATMAALATPPVDWASTNQPVGGVLHQHRVWGFGNDNMPHGVYGSGNEAHEDFQCAAAVFLQCYPGVGEKLMVGVSHDKRLYVFKYPVGIYWLDDSDVRVSAWRFEPITDQLGVVRSPQAALGVLRDVMFMSEDCGFHLLSGVPQGGARWSDLAEILRIKDWLRANVNLAQLSRVTSRWYEDRSLAVWCLPKAGSTVNDLRLMFDFSRVQSERRIYCSYSFRDTSEALFLRKATDGVHRPCFGDNAGKVWLLDQATRSKGASGYLGKVKFAETDLRFLNPGLATKKKQFYFLELHSTPQGAGTYTVKSYVDGVLKATQSFNANKKRERRRLLTTGYRLQVSLENSVAATDFSLGAYSVGFDVIEGRSA